MKTKIFALIAAFFMLMGGSAWAQADVKGDVNGDGVVNEQDIAAILLIMQQAGGVEQDVKYYWYVGQSNPAEMTTITSTVGAQGWRLITDPSGVKKENPLFDTTTSSEEAIVGTSSTNWYIAVPADKSYKIYDSDYSDQIAAGNFEKQSGTVLFNGVNYTVYKGVASARKWWGYTIY